MAAKLEFHIKTLSKEQKEELVQNPEKLSIFLAEKIDSSLYQKCQIDLKEGTCNLHKNMV